MTEPYYRRGHLPRTLTNAYITDGTRSPYAVNSPESFAVARALRERLGMAEFNNSIEFRKTYPCECAYCGMRFRGGAVNANNCGCTEMRNNRPVRTSEEQR